MVYERDIKGKQKKVFYSLKWKIKKLTKANPSKATIRNKINSLFFDCLRLIFWLALLNSSKKL